jgi:hypothetical protein
MTPGKIPVFRSVGAGLGFAVGRFFTVLRVDWLPMLLFAATTGASYWLDPGGDPFEFAGETTSMENAPLLFVIGLVNFAALLMLIIALTKAYFREGDAGRFFYFKFGGGELRLIGAYFIMAFLILFLLMFVMAAAAAIGYALIMVGVISEAEVDALMAMGAADGQQMGPALLWLVFPTLAVAVIVFYWAIFRVSLVLPVIVKENRIGVFRSWSLMKGNVWRMIAVMFLMLFGSIIVILPIVGAGAFATFALNPDLIPEGTGGEVDFGALEPSQLVAFWPLAIAGLMASLVYFAVYIGATGRAYEALAKEQSGD